MDDLRKHSIVRVRTDCEFQEFHPSRSKPVIDEIDAAFGRHFGFDAEAVDFVINYEIKYRMGQDDGEADE